MMRRLTLAVVIAAGAITGALLVSNGRTNVREAEAVPTQVMVINSNICFFLTLSDTFTPLQCIFPQLTSPASLRAVANERGLDPGIMTPEDWAGIDLDGNQVHQTDGKMYVFAFVDDLSPVTFELPRGGGQFTNGTRTFTCNATSPTPRDRDCGATTGIGTSEPVDGMVVAAFSCTDATCDLGEHSLNVIQEGVLFPMTYTVVGEPGQVEFFTLETQVQSGVADATECPLETDVAGFTEALGRPQKTVIIARALDRGGNAVTGALINWTVDPGESGVIAGPVTPTLDLGGFGFGAPNVLCALEGVDPSTISVTAQITRSAQGTTFDGNATEDDESVDFDLIGEPVNLTLSVAPDAVACDGASSATVSAQVSDADGNPAVGGTQVRFDVQVLGTANPIVAGTGEGGVATSIVTPLAVQDTGIPVIVTVEGVSDSILVRCGAGVTPAPGATPPGGVGTPPGGAPGGTIRPPDTGSGGDLDGRGALNVWVAIALFAGAMGLVGTRLALRRV